MAEGFSGTLDIQNEASVNSWKQDMERLNADAVSIIKDAGTFLKDFAIIATGAVFDSVVEYAGLVIEGMDKILEGMKKILEAVTNIVNKAKEIMDGLVQGVRQVKQDVLGQ